MCSRSNTPEVRTTLGKVIGYIHVDRVSERILPLTTVEVHLQIAHRINYALLRFEVQDLERLSSVYRVGAVIGTLFDLYGTFNLIFYNPRGIHYRLILCNGVEYLACNHIYLRLDRK